jgi:hypothetical protein
MRFLKLLLIAWLAWSLAEVRTPSVESLGGALLIAGITWLIIRSHPAEEFRVISRPSAAIILVSGLLGIGDWFNATEQSGLNPNQRLLDAMLSVDGLLLLIGLIGVVFLRPRQGVAGPSRE